MDFQAGQTLLFNKPKTWSSFDVVKKIRRVVRVKKVGHAGTLDPLATGLLIICTGKSTKTIPGIQDAEKEYVVDFQLGATTASYDLESEPEHFIDASHLTEDAIKDAMKAFVGAVQQTPPIFSAIKVNGKRAYESARAGKKIELKSRTIFIERFELLDYDAEKKVGKAVVVCSKGTYIRSLVHDLGQALNVGAYMAELVRTRIGPHKLENAWEIADFAEEFSPKNP
ncbi:tRNA pseudouridine(55) synthase TruB [Pontibacter sp. G13]|uniref:tRNA pseudouridine(55) synthase TruB n=1 Tax=Pontibacter sp. G13 TaxID=3074898 RepID=UPI0028891A3D|nr:tRNA pseudouridine(55) synthase TruB [Pontibacter sp. G13]WNJ20421.1 tRNA pseudouridine(55) synthase TruB [Pontibacter sp. G13]